MKLGEKKMKFTCVDSVEVNMLATAAELRRLSAAAELRRLSADVLSVAVRD